MCRISVMKSIWILLKKLSVVGRENFPPFYRETECMTIADTETVWCQQKNMESEEYCR